MTSESIVRIIGMSHLLQPPLTLALSRVLNLAPAFSRLGPLPGQIARNMAFASVALPTCIGLLIALHAREVVLGGPMQSLAWLASAFWTWRLVRQFQLREPWPRAPGAARFAWHLLALIFAIQGPGLAAVLL